MDKLTKKNLRHLGLFLRLGRNPAAAVYDSIGGDFFLTPSEGWLNLGLWEGDGLQEDALEAVERLVETLARELPTNAVVLDVGNGLGAQDPVIARVARPRRLIALNITESQLRLGADRLRQARAAPVAGDATSLPLATASVDGIISVEAAFHFSSRRRFFSEARRVLRPGGVLTLSDVSAERMPRTPSELFAGFTNLRAWGLKARNMMSASQIASEIRRAGFVDVRVQPCGASTIDPAVVFFRSKLDSSNAPAPLFYRAGSRAMLDQWALLRRRGVIEYLLISARVPDEPAP